ncbi:hypothetical protein RDI58_030021 [Solanum bulbocastanum]|uniref:Trichome birefringence-like C-terminal domain-containing protein n=1 Tax=Solanum bulbocastanum TaxID=147425 RepID=A0AAN8SY10_SOLBU
MDRVAAFERALFTWAKWIDTNINRAKTLLFFQGISPSHYNGTNWNEAGVKTCLGQRQRISGSTYPGGLPPAVTVLKKVLYMKAVTLLDVTNLCLLRKDGHPSIYGLTGMDCSIPGVPDIWNQILYNFIVTR